MSGFYRYLEEIMPLRKILLSLSVGIISLIMVAYSGMTSEYVRGATVITRALTAFSVASLACFIVMMSGEEYALYKSRRELERFIEEAELVEMSEKENVK